MKAISKNGNSLLALFVSMMLITACAPSKNTMTADKGQIPPAFKGYNQTLLIESQSKDWNKYAEKHFSENYTGKYMMVDGKDIETKYADKDKYRFVITRNKFTASHNGPVYWSDGTRNESYTQTSSQNVCMVDRKTGQTFCTGTSSFYARLLKEYAQALETARK